MWTTVLAASLLATGALGAPATNQRPLVVSASSNSEQKVNNTGSAPLKIWIVPHSHDDAGWLRTVDEYYVYEVQYILDTVIENLMMNPQRKFIEVEMAFFSRWWVEQDDRTKNMTRYLVDKGQLEFVYGGWVMPDEASPTYDAMIEQLTLGHEFIMREVGPKAKPKVAWSVDPFGSTSTLPTLVHQAGFENLIINRIDFRTKRDLISNKKMEFFWDGSKSLGKKARMFTHIMDRNYCVPRGFDWEHGVSQKLPEGDGAEVMIREGHTPSPFTQPNELKRATEFVEEAYRRWAGFPTNNVLIPFGCDFNYQNAEMKFKNLDYLIDAINKYSKELNAVATYSTLSEYLNAVRAEMPAEEFDIYTGDFFPYADQPDAYWTGYYTSRPATKQLVRDLASTLKSAEVLLSWSKSQTPFEVDVSKELTLLETARKAHSLFQHHDGITGTEREHVSDDYVLRMQDAVNKSEEIIFSAMGQLVKSKNPRTTPVTDLTFTTNINDVSNALVAGKTIEVRILELNGFSKNSKVVRVKGLPRSDVSVKSASGTDKISFQVNKAADGTYDLYFTASNIPALGFDTFLIVPGAKDNQVSGKTRSLNSDPSLSNEHLTVTFDSASGLPVSARSKSWETALKFSLISYAPSTNAEQTSGPYIFRPESPIPDVVSFLAALDSAPEVIEGPLVSEVRSSYAAGRYKITFFIFKNLPEIEGSAIHVDIIAGPLDLDIDLFAAFTTDVDTSGKFYTDDNGYETMERTILPNGRPEDADAGTSVAGNFYPVTSFAFIKPTVANKPRVSILTRRAHAVGAVVPGELQVGLHRRFARDDDRGVGEPLNDIDVVLSQFVISLVSEGPNSSRPIRLLAPQFQYNADPLLSVAQATSSGVQRFEPVPVDAIPPSVRVLSLRPLIDYAGKAVVIRLTNIYEVGEDNERGTVTTVDLDNVLKSFSSAKAVVREKTVTLLHELAVLRAGNRVIQLGNKETRTFVVEFGQN